ncbi:acetoin utilization protein AcuC [Nocardioides nematodiphilus]|uniref:acetoin utilization protein AcuC n=1 Tax=Nocardioides nematodiphilus TaxID=2849669 RepID=UPI001CD9245C|nr:acetoin utilization protein AcuC [Nocardioides nematodiphilus]MCA1981583.1 acetoin utilization protein AcuC [Nocardioides nematodiphilus]
MDGCTGGAAVVYDASLGEYDFGPSHPMAPVRVALTMRLAGDLGVLDRLEVAPAPMGTLDQLVTVHDPQFIEAVERAGASMRPDLEFGLGTEDNPLFPEIHHASAHIVGASIEACRRVWAGENVHAVNPMGGLHHAMPGKASGFCIYNDVAVGIQWLLDHGAERVAYVDVDVHHGDGVERVFWDDPRVLTISLHETGQMLFPGTGFADDVGGRDAQGSAANVALPPGTADHGWLRAFHAVVPDLIREFKPDILVTQQGCDSHAEDPLADLMLSVDGQRAAYVALHALAHEVCGGKWVAFGGGGYAVIDVVPRAWTHLLAVASGEPVDPSTEVPGAWREHVRELAGVEAPRLMTDGKVPAYRDWSRGYDPNTWLDRQVNATRMAVFPLLGLDPLP